MDPRFTESGITSYVNPLAGEQEKLVKATPGKLFYLRVTNTTGAKTFVHVVNGITNAGVPLMPPVPVAANDSVELKLPFAIGFSIGLLLGASTSAVAYAAAGANSLQAQAVFK